MMDCFRFRVLVCVLAVPLVSGCAPSEDETTGASEAEANDQQDNDTDNSGEAILMPDTAWLSVGSDGSVQTTFIDAGGRYRDFRNGVASDSGAWETRPDGSICMTPDAGRGDCWSFGDLEEDGSTIATSANGRRVEVKRITYNAPPVEDTEEAEESN